MKIGRVLVMLLFSVMLSSFSYADAAPMVKKVIGPAGGKIELKGDLSSVTMDIPAGALAKDTEITIRQAPTPPADKFVDKEKGVPVGNAFSFEPRGLTFSNIVTLTFTYNDKDLPRGADERNIFVYRSGFGGVFGLDEGARHHPDKNLITFMTGRLLDWILYYRNIERFPEYGCSRRHYEVELGIFGWSSKDDYFAFGYEWLGEGPYYIHRYILNSQENTLYKKFEKTIHDGVEVIKKERGQIDSTFDEELKKLGIRDRGELVYKGPSVDQSQKICPPPDSVVLQIKGQPYTLQLKKQYQEIEGHPRGKIAKFELSLINNETRQIQVLQQDKTFFRQATFDYDIYFISLSPQKDYIAVVIGKYEPGFEGENVLTFLCVTGRIDSVLGN